MVPSCGRRYCSARSLALYVAYSICIVLPSACKASPWAVYEGIRDLTQDDVASMATALRNTPVKHYRYLFDTAGGRRRRLGPLPHEVAMSSALRVLKVSEMVAPARPNSTQGDAGKGLNLNCLLDEMSVVDETVVFTHAVAATKVLSQQVEALVRRTEEVWAAHRRVVSDITHTLTSKDPTTEGSAGLVRTNVTAQNVLMSTISESIEARRWAGQTKRAILQRRWDIKKSAVSKRVESEVRSIEAALEGQRAALALEMALEKQALSNDTSGADEASLEILAAQRKVEGARLQARLDTELATAKMQIQAHEELQRLAQELAMERAELEASESRRYVHEVAGLLSDGALHFVVMLTSDWGRSGTLLLLLIALVVASVTAHDVAVLGKEALKRRFERPRLVRERKHARTGSDTVVLGARDEPSSPTAPPGLAKTRALLGRRGVIVPEGLEAQLHDVMKGVEVALSRGLPLRHVMLHGQPGTGKSMLIEAIAESVGLEVCVIGGSDFGPLGEMGAMELHKIFDWAARSPRGLMLVIEEADSALGDRQGQRLSDWRRSLLSAVLYYTGEASAKHMLVVVSNRPADIDQAVIDRMDMIIEVGLPGMAERSRLLQKLFKQYMPHVPLPTGGEQAASMLAPLARELEGFSCREVEKLVLAIQRPSLQESSQQAGEGTAGQLPDVMALAVKLAQETRASKQTGGRDRQIGQSSRQAEVVPAENSVRVEQKEPAGAATRESN